MEKPLMCRCQLHHFLQQRMSRYLCDHTHRAWQSNMPTAINALMYMLMPGLVDKLWCILAMVQQINSGGLMIFSASIQSIDQVRTCALISWVHLMPSEQNWLFRNAMVAQTSSGFLNNWYLSKFCLYANKTLCCFICISANSNKTLLRNQQHIFSVHALS